MDALKKEYYPAFCMVSTIFIGELFLCFGGDFVYLFDSVVYLSVYFYMYENEKYNRYL